MLLLLATAPATIGDSYETDTRPGCATREREQDHSVKVDQGRQDSAERKEDGGYLIDAAELDRIRDLRKSDTSRSDSSVQQLATPNATPETGAWQAEINLLHEIVEDLRTERDRLLKMIEEQASTVRMLSDQRLKKPRRWWPWGN